MKSVIELEIETKDIYDVYNDGENLSKDDLKHYQEEYTQNFHDDLVKVFREYIQNHMLEIIQGDFANGEILEEYMFEDFEFEDFDVKIKVK